MSTALNGASSNENTPENLAKIGPHISLLNELSERRRPNSFFVNEQSQRYGVQVGYVNVGKGNLTFLRRDMVVVGRIPIVAGRVYDSSATDSGDFGPGWRFSMVETVDVGSDGLIYTDESGSVEQLIKTTADGFSPEHPTISDVLSAKQTGNRLKVSMRGGWEKTFKGDDGKLKLTKVTDRNGNSLRLSYDDDEALARIRGDNGRFLDVLRNDEGLISVIIDDQQRRVSFQYESGQLVSVIDMGGYKWRYRYNDESQLKRIIDPLQSDAAIIRYRSDGRVSAARVRHRDNSFRYNDDVTIVTDGATDVTKFTQDASGITTKVENAAGVVSKIVLDNDLLPKKLRLNGTLRNKFEYDELGDLRSMTSYAADRTVTHSYSFDWSSGQIENMTASDGRSHRFAYDNRGRLKRKTTDGVTTRYQYYSNGDLKNVKVDGELAREFEYSGDGQIAKLADAGVEARFEYDSIGRLSRVSVPDDDPFEYEYDIRGFRTQTIAGGKRSEFAYDHAGRLYSVMHDIDGAPNGFTYAIDDANLTRRINAIDGTIIEIDYDERGNPNSYGTSDRFHRYSYDALGRFVSVVPSDGDSQSVEYEADEPGWRGRLDNRTGVNLSPEQTASAIYGSMGDIYFGRSRALATGPVRFDPSSATLQAMTNLGFVAPDTSQRAAFARSRLDTIARPQDDRMTNFNRPSSAFFLPPESNQVNCAVGCNVYLILVEMSTFNPTAGQSVSFSSEAFADFDCAFGIQNDWSWGDGSSSTTYGLFTWKSHTYQNPGLYLANTIASCACLGLIASQTTLVDVACQNTPPYSPPDATGIPNTTFLPEVFSGLNYVWGNVDLDPGTPGLACTQVCTNGQPKFRVTGQFSPVIFDLLVSENMQAQPCTYTARSTTRKNATVVHERIHANAFANLYTFYNTQLGQEYATVQQCQSAAVQLINNFTTAFVAESAKQAAHLDPSHAGEFIWARACGGAGQPTQEIQTSSQYP